MSHQVTVDFEGVSTKIQIQCDQAAHALCKIDKVLENVKANANKIESSKLREYEEYLLQSKEIIQNKIDSFLLKLESYKALKTQRVDMDLNYARSTSNISIASKWKELNGAITNEALELEKIVLDLTGAKLSVIDQLVNEGLISFIEESQKKILNEINGVKNYDESLVEQINKIDNISLRDLAFQQLSKGITNYDEIINNSQIEYNRLLQGSSFVENIQIDLKNAGIPQTEIDEIIQKPINISTVSKIQEEAHSKIVDESIRKETLKVIIKSIRDRGFIVDTKKNLKIDREKNIVKLIAKKPDGKTAEFEISLNGKFMYHFDGYEGLACNQDINPFLEDLKNFYDINILHEEVHWSNPDKIQTQKYQYINTNKNKK